MNHEGIGMGLMICQNLVRLNGGTISVHSLGEDKGSTFSFSMKMQIDRVSENCDLSTFEKQEMDTTITPMGSKTLPIKRVGKPKEKTKSAKREKFKGRLSLNSNGTVSSDKGSSPIKLIDDEEAL